jgi:hypothetical protein
MIMCVVVYFFFLSDGKGGVFFLVDERGRVHGVHGGGDALAAFI